VFGSPQQPLVVKNWEKPKQTGFNLSRDGATVSTESAHLAPAQPDSIHAAAPASTGVASRCTHRWCQGGDLTPTRRRPRRAFPSFCARRAREEAEGGERWTRRSSASTTARWRRTSSGSPSTSSRTSSPSCRPSATCPCTYDGTP
jgi:hypothetical protein